MAPGQARGHAEAASDRYSLAIIAYQLFTGQVPFRGDTPYSTLIQQITASPPPPRQLNPAIPETVEQAILQGMAKQPEERPGSCMILVRMLESGWRLPPLTLNLPARKTAQTSLPILNESLAWSPANPRWLAASDIDIATLWDVQQNKLLLTLKSNDPVPALTGLAWSPSGRYLAGSFEGSPRVYLWDIDKATGGPGKAHAPLFFFPQPGIHVHIATIIDVAWSPDGRYIASATGDATAVVWKVDAAPS